MTSKLALLLSTFALFGVARADTEDPEFQMCTKYKDDVHAFIECLSTARDEWDRASSNRLAEALEKVTDPQRRALYVIVKKQRETRYAKCGPPSPVTIHAAECQREMAMTQGAELDRAIAAMSM